MTGTPSPTDFRGQRRFARRDFRYGQHLLDRGQLVTLLGADNDERLVRLGYFGDQVEKKAEVYQCGECGAEFMDMGARTSHGDRRHRSRELNPVQEDIRQEQREAALQREAPLFLDKTAASQRG